MLANKFATVSNEFSPTSLSRINIPHIEEGSVTLIYYTQVLNQLLKLKTRKSTSLGDIPYLILKEYKSLLVYWIRLNKANSSF